MRVLGLLLIFFTVIEAQECSWKIEGEEGKYLSSRELEERLLSPEVYDKAQRPSVAEFGELDASPDLVTVQLELTSFDLNEIDLTVNPRGLLRYRWKDPRLQYISSSAENCSGFQPEWILSSGARDSIWRPDLYFENLRKLEFEGDESSGTWIYPDGSIFDSRFVNIIFDCPLKVKEMPLDRHTCKIRIGAYSLNDQSLQLQAYTFLPIDSRKTLDNAIWNLIKTSGKNVKINFGSVGNFDFVDLELRIRRRLGYHLLYSMGPGILFLLVGYCGFFMDREGAPARVTIAIIPVLIMRLLLNGVFARLETVSYSIYLSQFLIICMTLSCFCVFEYALVSIFLQREKVAQQRRTSLKSLGDRVVSAAIHRMETRRDSFDKTHSLRKSTQDSNTQDLHTTLRNLHTEEKDANKESVTTNFEHYEADLRSHRECFNKQDSDKSISITPAESAPVTPRQTLQKSLSIRRLGSAQRRQSWYHFVDREDIESDEEDDNDHVYHEADYNPALDRDLALLRKHFERYDADNSQSISPIEAAWVLRNYGVYINANTALLEIKNWRYLNGLRIKKNNNSTHLNFHQFADFLMGYENYTLGDCNDSFRFMPVSLKIDIICRVFYIPICLFIFVLHYYFWFLSHEGN